jgi:hypothetical protein
MNRDPTPSLCRDPYLCWRKPEVDGAADEARLTVGGVLRSGVSRFSYTYV